MISITGLKEIDQVLKNLPKEMSHKVLGSAHFAAAKPLVEKEKLLAPEGPTGNLVDSIGATRLSLKKASELGEVSVGPRRKGGYKGFAGHLVEYGTKERKNKKGAKRGKMPKNPFAKKAFAATKGQVESSIKNELGKVVLRTMKKFIK